MAKRNTADQNDTSEIAVAVATQVADPVNPLASKVATVAVVGLGLALIEVELIPGMLIGVAAMLAPDLLPRMGNALRPMLKGAVRAGYALAEKTRETVSEASEQFQDIVAEVRSEQGASAEPAPPHKETA